MICALIGKMKKLITAFMTIQNHFETPEVPKGLVVTD